MFRNFLSLSFAALILATAPVTIASDSSDVLLILDASGSMWGQIEGKPKIDIARSVVRNLLSDMEPSANLGLAAYGHRRKGDCEDIEVLVPVGPLDRAAVTAAVDGLSPKGKTPLSAAVRMAAEHLRYTEESATVILVSDGEETCDADPCQIGRELEAAGIDFTAHVIGFDVADRAEGQLRCLAEATGGTYTGAKSAADLVTALEATVSEISATLRNGGFEQNTSHRSGAYTTFNGGLELSGWRVEKRSVDLIHGYFTCAEGDACLDLDGTPGPGAISQTFATEPGATYEVSFQLGGNFDCDSQRKEIRVEVADTAEEFAVEGVGSAVFSRKSLQFTATSAQTDLTFISLSQGNCGALLDDISVIRK